MLFSDTRLNQSELNQMENLMKIFENDINNLNKIKTDIESIINKMKIINKNNSIYEDNLKHSLKKRKNNKSKRRRITKIKNRFLYFLN